MVITDFNDCNDHHDPTTIGLSMMMIPMRAATPLTKVRVPKAEVSRSTPRISTRAGGVTAHLRRGEIFLFGIRKYKKKIKKSKLHIPG